MTPGSEFPAGENRRAIPSARRPHGDCRGFRNFRPIKAGTSVILDPHITGCGVIVLDQHQAVAVRDTLAEGLG
ncbi:MAG: hypothetical protein ACRDR6_03065 [Pseudonocardiaceae bacterium]